ncbi:hypothetical protein [Pseudomonas halotolerans]|uniref:hypothetical protein n=1 Tax=Pseudomonas halotolerans TaxID=3143552 RepID=UPI0031D1D361
MNIDFKCKSREWLKARNGTGGPSAAARVAAMIEAIALFRTGVTDEAEFLRQMKTL